MKMFENKKVNKLLQLTTSANWTKMQEPIYSNSDIDAKAGEENNKNYRK